MNYEPTINDRVKWREHEGWVYSITDQYFTLEVATKPKEDNRPRTGFVKKPDFQEQ